MEQQIAQANNLIKHKQYKQATEALGKDILRTTKGKKAALIGDTLGSATKAEQVSTQISKSLVSLTQALGHVKNPKAQTSLEKNITKSLVHLQQNLNSATQTSSIGQTGNSEDNPTTTTTGQDQTQGDAPQGSQTSTSTSSSVSNSSLQSDGRSSGTSNSSQSTTQSHGGRSHTPQASSGHRQH